jgi:hypothetical protein
MRVPESRQTLVFQPPAALFCVKACLVQYVSDSDRLMHAEEQKAVRPVRALNTRGRSACDPRERNAHRRGVCIARYR